jgi:putative ABC transport system ATP-binding protein
LFCQSEACAVPKSSGILRVDKLSKAYASQGKPATEALKQISFTVPAGAFVALMGPSGCGKSTLLNLLAGLDDPTAGSIFIDDANLAKMNEAEKTQFRRLRLGFVFQFFNLLETLTVEENIALPLRLEGKASETSIQQELNTLLERLGISHRAKHWPSQLSGGEMQRVAIARALIHKPSLLLADEPTGNLDTETGASILALLKSLNQERGLTIVMATHSLEAAAQADFQLRLRDGQLVKESSSPTLWEPVTLVEMASA